MDQLIEAIRTATAAGATDEAKTAGANACRTLRGQAGRLVSRVCVMS